MRFQKRYSSYNLIIISSIIVALSCMTSVRNFMWHDEISLWQDVIQKNPRSARGYAILALGYKNNKMLTTAIEMNKKSLVILPDASVYNNLGNIYLSLGLYEDALSQFSKAISLKPNIVESYNSRGIAHFNRRQYDDAIEDYSKAIGYNSSFIEAYVNRGNAFDEKGLQDSALLDYSRAIELNSGYKDAYYNRGIIFLKAKRFTEAKQDIEEACALGSVEACGVLEVTKLSVVYTPLF